LAFEKSYTLIEISKDKGACLFIQERRAKRQQIKSFFFGEAKRRYQDFQVSLFLPSVENGSQ